jgi:hypothetical protein
MSSGNDRGHTPKLPSYLLRWERNFKYEFYFKETRRLEMIAILFSTFYAAVSCRYTPVHQCWCMSSMPSSSSSTAFAPPAFCTYVITIFNRSQTIPNQQSPIGWGVGAHLTLPKQINQVAGPRPKTMGCGVKEGSHQTRADASPGTLGQKCLKHHVTRLSSAAAWRQHRVEAGMRMP